MSNPSLKKIQSFIGKLSDETPSAFGRWLKPFIKKAERGKLEVEFTVRHEMTNPLGNLHGGVIAAIIDDITGATVFSLGGNKFYTTLNLNVDFFAPVKDGEVITVRTESIKEGKQFVHVQCEIFNEDNRIIARGSSNLFKTDVDVVM